MKLFNKKKEQAPLTPTEQIAAAQARVAQSLDVFRKAEEDVVQAQEELQTVIENAQTEITAQTEIINNAQAELNYNMNIHKKLSEFRG